MARLEPIADVDDPTGRIQRLQRAGVLRVGIGKPPLDLLRTPGPKLPDGVSLVDAVLAEREGGW